MKHYKCNKTSGSNIAFSSPGLKTENNLQTLMPFADPQRPQLQHLTVPTDQGSLKLLQQPIMDHLHNSKISCPDNGEDKQPSKVLKHYQCNKISRSNIAFSSLGLKTEINLQTLMPFADPQRPQLPHLTVPTDQGSLKLLQQPIMDEHLMKINNQQLMNIIIQSNNKPILYFCDTKLPF